MKSDSKKNLKKKLVRSRVAASRNKISSNRTTGNESTLKEYYESAGLLFDSDPDQVMDIFKARVGTKRFNQFWEINERRLCGEVTTTYELYDFLQTSDEVNIIFSQQSEVELAITEWIYSEVVAQQKSNFRLLELGCSTGHFTSWLAHKFQSAEIYGCDCQENFLEIANSLYKVPNLKFIQWDYESSSRVDADGFDILVSSLGVDFPIGIREGIVGPSALEPIRSGDLYRITKDFISSYFKSWRAVARDGARLFISLRCSCSEISLATIDAASEAKWKPDLNSFNDVVVGDERFCGMVFVAADQSGELISEDAILGSLAGLRASESMARIHEDSFALALFKSFSEVDFLKQESKTYDCGNTKTAYVCRSKQVAFLFTHATTGFARLQVIPFHQAERFEPRLEWED